MSDTHTNPADIFGPAIYTYTRAQAIADHPFEAAIVASASAQRL